jgi:hypothetical protein
MLNTEKVGRPLCRVVGGELSKKIISVSTDEKEETQREFSSIHLDDGVFSVIPDKTSERQIGYITGQSGSGKSTWVRKYCMEYRKIFPKNEIYLISSLPEDESLDEIKPKRICVDERWVSDPLSAEDFQDSLVISDDVDVISQKGIRKAIIDLLNQILEIGRHYRISCLLTNHLPTAGNDTKRILNECAFMVIFPHGSSARGLKYLCEQYLGLDSKDLKQMKKMKSRWCAIFKNFPMVCVCEKDIWLPSEEEEKETNKKVKK